MKNIKTLLWAILFLVVSACNKESNATAAEPATHVETLSSQTAPSAPGNFKEGKDYTVLATALPTRDANKIEVIEFFWYGCPHCYKFEPELEAWAAKLPSYVDFWRSPVMWGPVKQIHAQVYYTAESLGVLDKTHKPFFEVVHAAEEKAQSENVYATPDEIKAFFKTQGVDGDKFDQIFPSFFVASKLKLADERGRSYGIQGVPTLVVNGKYVVPGSAPNSLAIVDYLIAKEKK